MWENLAWTNEQLRHELREGNVLGPALLRKAICRNLPYATQFPPHSAKAVYLALGSRRVLDPCFGWGDRFAGAMCTESVVAYHGVDCRRAAEIAFHRQCLLYGRVFPEKVAASSFQLGGSESVTVPQLGFDTVFTSPPAFNKELYPGADGWANFEDYYRLFLVPMLLNVWKALCPGGHLAIHKADRRDFAVCDRMLRDVCETFPGAVYKGYIGLQLTDVACRDPWTLYCEPVWVWQKVAN